MTRHSDLSSPRQIRRVGLHYDREAFGQFSEGIARYLGTARFLVWQTVIIIGWIGYNYTAPARYQFDPEKRGLVLLTLVLSLQASYAAPLILLAQNRQELRDRSESDNDRNTAARTQADTEFLAREISSVRVALADMVTTEDLRDNLERLTSAVERMANRLDELEAQSTKDIPLDQPREEPHGV
jgi:uncharacterized membrane protein